MSNHVIIFKAERNASQNNAQVQQCQSDAKASAPRYLSRRETNDQIASLKSASGHMHSLHKAQYDSSIKRYKSQLV